MADVCDVAYAALLERWERQALAVMSAGGDVNVGSVLDELDAALAEEPTVTRVDPDQLALRRALGVA